MNTIIEKDLDEIFSLTRGLWEELRGKRLFITGGTGFFGAWLLRSFAKANNTLGLNAQVLALSRNPDSFKSQFPDLAKNPAILFHQGDIRDFKFPEGKFGYVIHMATTTAAETFNKEDELKKFDTVAFGTRRALEFAALCKAKKFLYTSSASLYGKQPPELTHMPETYNGAPDPTDLSGHAASLGMGKRAAEFFCAYYAKQSGMEVKIARGFSFVGPGLPLDIHYAIGNFIRDALNGGPIKILGDGTARRSYMYISDLIVWLWVILLKGKSGRAYNVGSEEDISISSLAHLVAENFSGSIQVNIAKSPVPGAPPDRQVPSTARAQKELGLKQIVGLKEAVIRTIKYHETAKN